MIIPISNKTYPTIWQSHIFLGNILLNLGIHRLCVSFSKGKLPVWLNSLYMLIICHCLSVLLFHRQSDNFSDSSWHHNSWFCLITTTKITAWNAVNAIHCVGRQPHWPGILYVQSVPMTWVIPILIICFVVGGKPTPFPTSKMKKTTSVIISLADAFKSWPQHITTNTLPYLR